MIWFILFEVDDGVLLQPKHQKNEQDYSAENSEAYRDRLRMEIAKKLQPHPQNSELTYDQPPTSFLISPLKPYGPFVLETGHIAKTQLKQLEQQDIN